MPLYGEESRVRVTDADDIAQYLQDKLTAGDSISITKEVTSGVETLRIAAVVSEVFSTDFDQAQNTLTTSSTTAQNAGVTVAAPVDGDYIAFFEGDTRVTNNNGKMAITLSTPNTTTEETDATRIVEGNDRSSSITIQPYLGLEAGDTITGLYRKEAGSGTAEIRKRTLFLQRIG